MDSWKKNLTIIGMMTIDMKALVDLLQKTNRLIFQRQTILVILVAKQLVERA